MILRQLTPSILLKVSTVFLSAFFGFCLPLIMELDSYGNFLAFLNLVNVSVLVLSFGFPTFILRHLSGQPSVKVRSNYKAALTVGATFAAVPLFSLLFLLGFAQQKSISLAISFSFITLLTIIYKTFSVFFQIDARPITYQVISQFVRPLLWAIVLLSLLAFEIQLDVQYAAITELAIVLVCALFVIPHFFYSAQRFNQKLLKLAFPLSFFLGVASMLLGASAYFEILVVDLLMEPKDVAYYGFSLRVVGLADVFILAAIVIYGPKLKPYLASGAVDRTQVICSGVARLNVCFVGLFSIVICLLGEGVLARFFPQLTEAAGLILLLLCSKFISSFFAFSSLMTILTYDRRRLVKLAAFLLFVNVAVLFLSVLNFGVVGAAYSNIIFSIFSNIIFYSVVKQGTGVRTFIY